MTCVRVYMCVCIQRVRAVLPLGSKTPITALNESEHRMWFDILEDRLDENPMHDEDEDGLEDVRNNAA
jgi:hypothetical protein